MSITIDHMVVYARDHETASQQFSDVMGLRRGRMSGVGYDFTTVHFRSGLSIYFMDREEGSLEQHIAFSVDGRTFNQIHKRLKDQGIAFGSNPDERENEQINHTFAPRGLYWENVDGCLFEVMTYEY